jgi:hypothetical protein
VRKKLLLGLLSVVLGSTILMIALPTQAQLQTYVSQPHSYGLDSHSTMSYALAWKARLGSEACLAALMQATQNLDGGYTVGHGGALRFARRHCSPATFERILGSQSPEIQERVNLIR